MNAWTRIDDATLAQSRTVVSPALKDRQAGARDAAKQEVLFLLRGLGTVMN